MLDTKHHILHDFRTSTRFKERSYDHFKDLRKLKLQRIFYVDLTSFLGGVTNYRLNVLFITRPRNDVRLTLEFDWGSSF